VHRWYLLLMLFTKVALIVFRVARIPPLMQCALVTLAAFTLPPELGCLTEERCESTSANDVSLWRGSLVCDPSSPLACTRQEDGLRTYLAPLWKVLFQGPYADSWSMFSSILMRYYVIFAAIYFWAFFYSRQIVSAFAMMKRGTKPVGCTLCASSIVGLVAVELFQSAMLGPRVYDIMQQNYMGTYLPQLLSLLGVLLLLILAVVFLTAAVSSAGGHRRPLRVVRLAGSTTLGCYVVHMYFTLGLTFAQPMVASLPVNVGSVGGLVVQLLWLFGMPLAFQLTVGVVFHKLLMLEMKLVLFAVDRVLRCVWASMQRVMRCLPWRYTQKSGLDQSKTVSTIPQQELEKHDAACLHQPQPSRKAPELPPTPPMRLPTRPAPEIRAPTRKAPKLESMETVDTVSATAISNVSEDTGPELRVQSPEQQVPTRPVPRYEI